MGSTENLIHNIATVAFVLGRDDLSVRNIRDRYSEFALPSLLDGLLRDLEESILEMGHYDVPTLINAERIVTLMQLEIGSEVEVKTTDAHSALGARQYLVMKYLVR